MKDYIYIDSDSKLSSKAFLDELDNQQSLFSNKQAYYLRIDMGINENNLKLTLHNTTSFHKIEGNFNNYTYKSTHQFEDKTKVFRFCDINLQLVSASSGYLSYYCYLAAFTYKGFKILVKQAINKNLNKYLETINKEIDERESAKKYIIKQLMK